ncbi:hypothetical protein BPTFM16_02223 [Altererythrobacter insulae]|nr:hypothetical protein BPTFM16_02223 [Altererythrobacter insulae]
MAALTRRGLLGCTAGAFASIAVVPALANSLRQLPEGQQRLSRKLVRSLSDGARVVVDRAWDIQFARRGNGIAITGNQVSVSVEAPQAIASIAAIEQSRDTGGQFPIILDADGMIVAAAREANDVAVGRAVQEAEKLIAASGAQLAQQKQMSIYLGHIQAQGSGLLETMPADLFFPTNDGFTDKRAVHLPTGQSGEFIVSYSAKARTENGMLDSATRTIITRLGATEQRSSEHWILRQI